MAALALAKLWKPAALAALLAAALVYRSVLIHERNSARARAAALANEVAQLKASNSAFQDAVSRQSAAVDELREKLDRSELAMQQREKQFADEAAQITASGFAKARALEHAEVPSGCEGAIRWGNLRGPELGRW
jgi:septal ring factor EnvC (AmiA/AmiB activator)